MPGKHYFDHKFYKVKMNRKNNKLVQIMLKILVPRLAVLKEN